MQGNGRGRRSAVRSGLVTGVSTAAVSGSAAIAGAILSRKFGHGVKTDGFFAGYSVYLALVLVADSLAAPHLAARALTSGPRVHYAAELLPWLVPAAAVQILAGVVASAL